MLKDYTRYDGLKNKFDTEIEFIDLIKVTFNNSQYELREFQENYKECVDFVFNISEKENLKGYKFNSRFIAYMIKRIGDVYGYSYKIEVIKDNYANNGYDFVDDSLENLVIKIDENDSIVPITNIYTSTELSNILYVILEELAKTVVNTLFQL